MAYETNTLSELEKLATALRAEIALHPRRRLDRTELKKCKQWIELRRRELDPSSSCTVRGVTCPPGSAAGTET